MKARVSFKTLLQVLLIALVLNVVAPGVLPGMLCANAAETSNGKRPTVLLILDGYGVRDETEHNAIALADTPVMDRLMRECPFAKGNASGLAVGLPEGQMGSSEVGHLNIGAGRIVYQDLTRITKAIEDGDFFENEALLKAMNSANLRENDCEGVQRLLYKGNGNGHCFHYH